MRLGLLRLPVIAFALSAVLAACTSPPPAPTFPDIHFTGEAPIRLAVSNIAVESDFRPSYQAPHVEHLFPVPPEHAMENWAHDRLIAAGGNATARFVIEDASVVEIQLKPKSEGITGAFTRDPAQRYDATIAARLDIVDDHGIPVRTVEVKVTRSQSVLQGITPNDRERTWYDMTQGLMADFDQQMSAQISAHFGGYFQ
ncbi:MAG TPA: hypothetical protein VE397_15085 [Stellaceae bacterium]|nr:hypothetical protein [Stellaceae bacterium]